MDEKINNNIVIDRTLISRLTALMLIAGLFLFIAGYFLGKKQGVHEFLRTFENESFADQIYTALHNLYPLGSLAVDYIPAAAQSELLDLPETVDTSTTTTKTSNSDLATIDTANANGYYANIIGFRTRKAAEHFKERLRKRAIESVIKERKSTTLKGKKTIWYQVSTKVYADKSTLVDVIEHIKKVENVKEISLRTI